MLALRVCGVDEAGRGPIAGPVFAAAVLLDEPSGLAGLRDSKQLSASQRSRLASEIRMRARAWAVGLAGVEEIDTLNILQATMLAMKRAVDALPMVADEVWIDGNRCPTLRQTARAVIGGDRSCAAISAASILAKTTRDEEMLRLHAAYPTYRFDHHKGYATLEHLELLRRNGVSPVHRRSVAPVRAILNEPADQANPA